MADSKNGVWFDTKAGKVVNSEPEEGVQLVAPGQEVTAAAQATIDRYKADADGTGTVERAVSTESVETATTPRKARG